MSISPTTKRDQINEMVSSLEAALKNSRSLTNDECNDINEIIRLLNRASQKILVVSTKITTRAAIEMFEQERK